MTSLYPSWCNNGGPLNRKIVVSIDSLLLTNKALNFAWGVFRRQSFVIRRKIKSDFFFFRSSTLSSVCHFGSREQASTTYVIVPIVSAGGKKEGMMSKFFYNAVVQRPGRGVKNMKVCNCRQFR